MREPRYRALSGRLRHPRRGLRSTDSDPSWQGPVRAAGHGRRAGEELL